MFRARTLIFSVALAALVYIALSAWSNVGLLKEALSHFHWALLPVILLLSLCNYSVRFANWQFYLKSIGIREVKRKESLLIFLSGFSMSITPGKVGELIKSYLLKQRYQIPISKTGSIVFVDRLTDLIALIVIAGLGGLYFQYGARVLVVLAVILTIIIICISSRNIAEFILKHLGRLPGLIGRADKLYNLYESSYVLLAPRRLAVIIPLSILAWTCEAVGFYLTFLALGIPAGLFAAFFIYAFSTIIGALSILPGGLGLTEGSMAGLLVLINIPKGQAAAATLVIRVATLWFAVLIGIGALLISQKLFGSTSGEEPAKVV